MNKNMSKYYFWNRRLSILSTIKKNYARLLRIIFRPVLQPLNQNSHEIDAIQMMVGQLHATRLQTLSSINSIQEAEFSVYSQWGEDGIIQYLVSNINIPNHVFIEFGVENYTESNTRFLLKYRNWQGLVLDGSSKNIAYIQQDNIYWQYDLKAIQAFITAENINQLIKENGITGDIGLLSIDIDGNDYWVWKAIEVISPRIVICEYNSLFGAKHSITVPYNPNFIRAQAHYSNLYYGASLVSLCELGLQKGYEFVGCNSAGNNAFFVRQDCIGKIVPDKLDRQYKSSKFRESRDEHGRQTFITGESKIKAIADCIVYDVNQKKNVKIRDLDLLG